MEPQSIYCELDFLIQFMEERPSSQGLEESKEKRVWNKYLDMFLCTPCIYYVDVSKEKFFSMHTENELIRLIMKKSTDKEGIEILGNQLENIEDDSFFESVSPHALFFLTNDKKCSEMEEDYGMIFISKENKTKHARTLFNPECECISKNEDRLRNWEFISKYKHPFNSIIITDNYILKEDQSKKIEDNLIGLLKELLPSKLNKRNLQIIILTENQNYKLEERYQRIMNLLGALKKPYQFELKIVAKSLNNHDRNLLTNYLWMTSGYGFSIFKQDKGFKKRLKTNQNTHIDIKSYPHGGGSKSVCSVVSSLKDQYAKIERDGVNIMNVCNVMPEDKQGTVCSRLLKNPTREVRSGETKNKSD